MTRRKSIAPPRSKRGRPIGQSRDLEDWEGLLVRLFDGALTCRHTFEQAACHVADHPEVRKRIEAGLYVGKLTTDAVIQAYQRAQSRRNEAVHRSLNGEDPKPLADWKVAAMSKGDK